ncbi:UDP-phosphate alpha N-acetylglucosaminyltransferase [Neokomagataea tanensis]|uniref:UDP-phosphate alpha N-acetylglucosaminyltransferase n=1 Tax=Neokomagataea tanensis TaxID=661191 RepID=A0A4Y6V763_9PROT|nr:MULTISPECIES: UDP-phosphate alpha N-acetylglucosaminyltransferase [Neokomagataea]QDH25909.1 UDP-phosphate alpha N-acetylglucosaminyltransferase [Neokomagataea tanensis]
MLFSVTSLLSGLTPACYAVPALCVALILIMIRIAVLDHPVARSAHTRPTPKGGGIGIIGSFLLTIPWALASHPQTHTLPIAGMMAGVFFLAVVSWADDIYSFKAWYKLAAQCLAAFLVALPVTSSPFVLGIDVLLAVFMTNALNFIDGINGLCAGSIAIACFILALTGLQPEVLLLLALALLTFLPFNFPKARIFMGDVGSQSAALVMAWCAIQPHPFEPYLVLALFSGIFWDVLFTLIRRAFAGNKLMHAHRGHLYQLATRSGVPVSAVTLLYWVFTLWGAFVWSLPLPTVSLLLGIILPQALWTVFICLRARQRITTAW